MRLGHVYDLVMKNVIQRKWKWSRKRALGRHWADMRFISLRPHKIRCIPRTQRPDHKPRLKTINLQFVSLSKTYLRLGLEKCHNGRHWANMGHIFGTT